jgi:hypothetical protein
MIIFSSSKQQNKQISPLKNSKFKLIELLKSEKSKLDKFIESLKSEYYYKIDPTALPKNFIDYSENANYPKIKYLINELKFDSNEIKKMVSDGVIHASYVLNLIIDKYLQYNKDEILDFILKNKSIKSRVIMKLIELYIDLDHNDIKKILDTGALNSLYNDYSGCLDEDDFPDNYYFMLGSNICRLIENNRLKFESKEILEMIFKEPGCGSYTVMRLIKFYKHFNQDNIDNITKACKLSFFDICQLIVDGRVISISKKTNEIFSAIIEDELVTFKPDEIFSWILKLAGKPSFVKPFSENKSSIIRDLIKFYNKDNSNGCYSEGIKKIISSGVLLSSHVCDVIVGNPSMYSKGEIKDMISRRLFMGSNVAKLIKCTALGFNSDDIDEMICKKFLLSHNFCELIIKKYLKYKENEIKTKIVSNLFDIEDSLRLIVFCQFDYGDIKEMVGRVYGLSFFVICDLICNDSLKYTDNMIKGMILDKCFGQFNIVRLIKCKKLHFTCDELRRILSSSNITELILDKSLEFNPNEIIDMINKDVLRAKDTRIVIEYYEKCNEFLFEFVDLNVMSEILLSSDVCYFILNGRIKCTGDDICKIIEYFSELDLMELLKSSYFNSDEKIKIIHAKKVLSFSDICNLISNKCVECDIDKIVDIIKQKFNNIISCGVKLCDIMKLIKFYRMSSDDIKRIINVLYVTTLSMGDFSYSDICKLILEKYLQYDKSEILKMILNERFNSNSVMSLIQFYKDITSDDIKDIVMKKEEIVRKVNTGLKKDVGFKKGPVFFEEKDIFTNILTSSDICELIVQGRLKYSKAEIMYLFEKRVLVGGHLGKVIDKGLWKFDVLESLLLIECGLLTSSYICNFISKKIFSIDEKWSINIYTLYKWRDEDLVKLIKHMHVSGFTFNYNDIKDLWDYGSSLSYNNVCYLMTNQFITFNKQNVNDMFNYFKFGDLVRLINLNMLNIEEIMFKKKAKLTSEICKILLDEDDVILSEYDLQCKINVICDMIEGGLINRNILSTDERDKLKNRYVDFFSVENPSELSEFFKKSEKYLDELKKKACGF